MSAPWLNLQYFGNSHINFDSRIPERCQLKMPLFTIVYYLLYIFNVLILITKKITNAIFSEGELACFQIHSASKSRVRMVMENICLTLKCVSNWIKKLYLFIVYNLHTVHKFKSQLLT